MTKNEKLANKIMKRNYIYNFQLKEAVKELNTPQTPNYM